MKIVSIVFVGILLLYFIPTPENQPIGYKSNIDVPTLRVGDIWNYSTHMYMKSETTGDWMDMRGNLSIKVISVTTFTIEGIEYDVYNLSIEGGTVGEGEFTYQGQKMHVYFDGSNTNEPNSNIPAPITGYQIIKRGDCGRVFRHEYQVGYGHVKVMGSWYKSLNKRCNNMYDSPVVEDMDFNTSVGDRFTYSTTETTYGWMYYEPPMGSPQNESFYESNNVSRMITCEAHENVDVPAGTFECLKSKIEDVPKTKNLTYQWYNSTVGNVVKVDGTVMMMNNYTHIWINLTGYYRVVPSSKIVQKITPNSGFVNSNVTISGKVYPAATTEIILKIPETSYEWKVTTNADGEYSKTITVPYLIDNTPTTYDIGSVGVVAYLSDNKDVYTVSTLTILSEHMITLSLNPGWNLISLPIIPYEKNIEKLLAPIRNKYDTVMIYNTTWKIYSVNKPEYLNSLIDVDVTDGIWIHITWNNDVKFLCAGIEPTSTKIHLTKGWNLIGYPSKVNRKVSDVKNEIATQNPGVECVIIQKFDKATSYNIKTMTSGEELMQGNGYWIYVTGNCVWTVSNN